MFKNIKEYAVLLVLSVSVIVSEKFIDIYILPKQFFITFCIPILLIIVLLWILSKKERLFLLKVDSIDCLFFLYTIYSLANYFMANGVVHIEQDVILICLYFIFYFLIKQSLVDNARPLNVNYLLPSILLFPLFQSLFGILEYCGIIEMQSVFFKIGGSFGNPGPYSNFITASYPLSFGLLLLKNKQDYTRLQWTIILSTFIFSTISIILSQARTAWITASLGGVLIALYKYHANIKYIIIRYKWLVLFFAIIIVTISSIQLYQYKHNSSLGRLFIWELSIKSISENPVFGKGFNRFIHSQNLQQANYFKNNPEDVKKGFLADNNLFAFNDYLEIWVELGLIGLFLFALIVGLIIFNFWKKYVHGIKNIEVISIFISFIGILISAFFSYPLKSIPVLLYFYVYLAILSSVLINSRVIKLISKGDIKLMAISLIIVALVLLNFQIKRCKANLEWRKAAAYIRTNRQHLALSLYDKVYPRLKYSGNFLYNYGAELSIVGHYEKSIQILEECKNKLNDADVYTYLGNSYENLGMLTNAEESFKQASFIVPHKLYPRYRLVYVYANMGKLDKAISTAKSVLLMKPKVDSPISIRLKSDLQQFIKSVDTIGFKK